MDFKIVMLKEFPKYLLECVEKSDYQLMHFYFKMIIIFYDFYLNWSLISPRIN